MFFYDVYRYFFFFVNVWQILKRFGYFVYVFLTWGLSLFYFCERYLFIVKRFRYFDILIPQGIHSHSNQHIPTSTQIYPAHTNINHIKLPTITHSSLQIPTITLSYPQLPRVIPTPPLPTHTQGEACERQCRPGRWGEGCRQSCRCLNGATCDPVTGK